MDTRKCLTPLVGINDDDLNDNSGAFSVTVSS